MQRIKLRHAASACVCARRRLASEGSRWGGSVWEGSADSDLHIGATTRAQIIVFSRQLTGRDSHSANQWSKISSKPRDNKKKSHCFQPCLSGVVKLMCSAKTGAYAEIRFSCERRECGEEDLLFSGTRRNQFVELK